MTTPIDIPNSVFVGDVTYSPNSTLGPRIQLNIQLVFLQAGSMTIWIDEQQHTIQARTVMLLLPSHREYFEFDKHHQTEHSYLHWYSDPISQDFLNLLESLPHTIPLSQTMNHLVENALAFRFSSLPTADQLAKIQAMEMMWRYIGESQLWANNPINTHKNQIYSLAQRYIHQHYSANIALSDIATAVSVSETHLIRIFNKYAQTTPMSYLWDLRITQALELLIHTGLSISEVALQTGFKTSYHFSRRIREKTGLSPTEFRKQSWGQR
jgi:AraC-like DNA-binding protein